MHPLGKDVPDAEGAALGPPHGSRGIPEQLGVPLGTVEGHDTVVDDGHVRQ